MLSLEETEVILNELTGRFPAEFFRELNGGVLLLPEVRKDVRGKNIYILGEYHSGGMLGKYIAVYYGSLKLVYFNLDRDRYTERLYELLRHELTHHIETLAGVKDLAKKDRERMARFYGKAAE